MGAHEMGRNIEAWQWNLFIPAFCEGVFKWFRDSLALQGLVDTTDIKAQWTPPSRTIVDPSKEYSALLAATKAGFMSTPEAIRQQGYDPDEVIAEQAEYLAKLDTSGVSAESDFRNKGGIAAPQPAGGNNG
jgi:capsid protein